MRSGRSCMNVTLLAYVNDLCLGSEVLSADRPDLIGLLQDSSVSDGIRCPPYKLSIHAIPPIPIASSSDLHVYRHHLSLNHC